MSHSVSHSVTQSIHLATQSLSHSATQPLSHPATQSLSHSATCPLDHSATQASATHPLSHSATQPNRNWFTWPLSHSVIQPLSHSATQSLSHSATYPLDHSATQASAAHHSPIQLLSHSVTQSFSHSPTQSLSHSAIQPLSHSVTQPLSQSLTQSLNHSVFQPLSHSATQPLSPSTNWQASCMTFSAMTEKQMQRSFRRLKRTNPTWPPTHVRSSQPMSARHRFQVRFTSWPQFSGTSSTMTETPMLRSLRSLKIQESTCAPTRSRSSRQQTWPILPAIWLWRLMSFPSRHRIWKNCPKLMTNDKLNFLPMLFWADRIIQLQISSLYFDFASIAISCLRDQIRASLATMQSPKQPRGSEACVWNIWKDVKLLTHALNVMIGFFYFWLLLPLHLSRCTGPRLHSSVRGQRSYWCLERICSLINCTYLHPVSKMGRGSTQEPPCRQFAIFIFSALLSQSVHSTIYSRLTELHQNTLILRART